MNDLNIPDKIINGANEVISNLLPDKSRDKYLETYNKFIKWKEAEGVDIANYSETVMLAYFNDLSKKYKASSLWAFYSMLKTTIVRNDNVEIKYPKLISFLKKQSVGFVSKKSEVFEPKHINSFLLDAPDKEFLDSKVVLIFGIYGATRADELTNVLVSDVKIHGEVIVVKIGKTKTNVIRSFTIENEYAAYVQKYITYRPSATLTERFFLDYRNGKCTIQPIGRNKFLGMPKKIANFLKLPNADQFSGHSFRGTSATLLADGAADIMILKRHGGWKSSNVADSLSNERKIDSIIAGQISSTSTVTKKEFINVNETHFGESSLELYDETIDTNLTESDKLLEVAKKKDFRRSRDKYLETYNKFIKWKEAEGVDIANCSETVMLAYFNDLSKKYKASSLWAFYSMLKTTIVRNDNVEIKYPKLISFLKKQSVGFVSKKSEAFEPKHINSFLADAPDNKFLDCKVLLIFAIYGATRADELTNVLVSDVKIHGEVIVVKAGKTKTNVIRSFTIENEYAAYVQKYINYRPSATLTERFFLNYRNGKCTIQPIGRNKFLGMPKKIAKFLKLPNADQFSRHSFRRTSATLLADGGADIMLLKRHGGRKSSNVAEGYVQDSLSNKRKIGSIIAGQISSTSTVTKKEFINVNETHFEESSLELYDETIDTNLTESDKLLEVAKQNDFGRNDKNEDETIDANLTESDKHIICKYVCETNFASYSIHNKKIKKGVIPTENLPSTETNESTSSNQTDYVLQFKCDPDESAAENQTDDSEMDTAESENQNDQLYEQPIVKLEPYVCENSNEVDPLTLRTITTVENISKRQSEDILVFKTVVSDVTDSKIDPLRCQPNAITEPVSDVNRSQNVPPLAIGISVKPIDEIIAHGKRKCEHCSITEMKIDRVEKKLKSLLLKYKHLSKRYAREKKKFQTKSRSPKMQSNSVNLENEIDKLSVSENTKIFSKAILFAAPPDLLPDPQRDFCRNIFNKSKDIYLYLRNELKLNLPFFVSFKKCTTLSDTKTFRILTKQAKRLDVNGRQCSIIVNGKESDVDGQKRIDNNRPSSGKTLSFVIRGDFREWENSLDIPSDSITSGDQLKDLLFNNLCKLFDIGYVVNRITCDPNNVNRECFSLLNVTKDKPYIALNAWKIYCIYDSRSLARECRDTLLKGYEYKTVDGVASWKVVQATHKLDKLKRTKLCPNITDSHITPNRSEKLSTDLATQVLSASCASAIKKRLEQQEYADDIKMKALSTANFFEKFDSLYGHVNCDANGKAITSVKSDDEVQRTLHETKMYFTKITCKRKVVWIDDLVQSLKATLLLADKFDE